MFNCKDYFFGRECKRLGDCLAAECITKGRISEWDPDTVNMGGANFEGEDLKRLIEDNDCLDKQKVIAEYFKKIRRPIGWPVIGERDYIHHGPNKKT